jgi:hypothetical protein
VARYETGKRGHEAIMNSREHAMRSKMNGLWLAAAAVVALSAAAGAKEVKVKPGEVPAAVMDTLHVHYPAAKFLGFSKEIENGSTLFEAEMKVDGRNVDALLDSVGTFQEVETGITEEELPAAVRRALGKSRYAEGEFKSAERHIVPGSTEMPTYELHVELKGESYELVYDAGGHLKQHEESDEKD